ncbi:MAG TPA: DUF1844 domain-containing protein [Pyrinomonadaceae bacterium]|nr:DUF1844 domain-containing protein [Pyrinomonadaceae bacterium]
MSEEKPTFKVTDRRLFNSDGTPRDIAREEEPPRPEPPAPSEAPPPVAQRAEAEAAPAVESAPVSPGEMAESRGAERESAAAYERERDAPPVAGDPQDFFMLVEFLASFAADALGMVNHPGGGGVNLQLAQQCIDMLGTLHAKTHGNLSGEEQQFLDMILSQLRMQYVSLTTAPRPPQGGRGFTGGDITGGR